MKRLPSKNLVELAKEKFVPYEFKRNLKTKIVCTKSPRNLRMPLYQNWTSKKYFSQQWKRIKTLLQKVCWKSIIAGQQIKSKFKPFLVLYQNPRIPFLVAQFSFLLIAAQGTRWHLCHLLQKTKNNCLSKHSHYLETFLETRCSSWYS